MALVYQHYAPLNLASFVQRKGRGGRGSDDRPVTGVTLSNYSPKDVWLFRHPGKMIQPDGFVAPLNAQNYFVKRSQVLAVVFDRWAREATPQDGRESPGLKTALGAHCLADKVKASCWGP